MTVVLLLLCLVLGASLAAPSGAASQSSEVLDQKHIHEEYTEGNFEYVLASLESFMSRNNTSYSLEDSIFLAKHLGVVYSASPETREMGKYYMYELLTLQPSAYFLLASSPKQTEKTCDIP